MAATQDPRTGEVRVEVDGKTYGLLCDINALIDFQQASGSDAMAFVNSLGDAESGEPDLGQARLLVHCMMIQTDPDATLRDAGRVLSVAPLAMIDAVGAGMPDAPSDPAQEDEAPGEAPAA